MPVSQIGIVATPFEADDFPGTGIKLWLRRRHEGTARHRRCRYERIGDLFIMVECRGIPLKPKYGLNGAPSVCCWYREWG
jgi:hypothetical protein